VANHLSFRYCRHMPKRTAAPPPDERGTFTVAQAASYLQVNEDWLRKQARACVIQGSRTSDGKAAHWLFTKADLDAWLERNRVKPIRKSGSRRREKPAAPLRSSA
jgi:excisionase family DNA binding protein